ncbi:MAG TPA: carboxylating nicotinate-nucleotide diphosphorylase [Burkholderiales bacterium]|nr:carboxylating nicotinate-nucleotide diphosphorylase [Burkholderiales bacterium]
MINAIIAKNVADALMEDIYGLSDWTSNLIDTNLIITASLLTREDMILCGCPWANLAFKLCDENIKVNWNVKEGTFVAKNTELCKIEGRACGVLKAERTAINFIQTLSATATLVASYVEVIKDTNIKLMDTRKTIPGLRFAQKYAVTIGGGCNQRFGLYDGVLIKENHIKASNGIKEVLKKAYTITPANIPIQIEVETFEQLKEALDANAKLILLDNMSIPLIKKCVKHTNKKAQLEVSGNIDINNVRKYALTGVDRISIGALTKNIKAIDISMRIQ